MTKVKQVKTEITSVYRFKRKWFDGEYPEKAQASQKILDSLSQTLENRRKTALEFYKTNGINIQESEKMV